MAKLNPLATLHQRSATLAQWLSGPPRPAFERIGIYPTDGVQWFDQHSGTWRLVYQRGHLPTPGAMDMAYMSQAKGRVPICGPGFDVQGPRWRAFQPEQAFSPQAVSMSGVPTVHGQVFNQPLDIPSKYQAPSGKTGI
jgi:hypothetical protein